jgi:poly-beta-1,6-N-acetyl-D-glucosamine N-deacetylase
MSKTKVLSFLLALMIIVVFLQYLSPLKAQPNTEIVCKPFCSIQEKKETLQVKVQTPLKNEKRKIVLLFENENHSLVRNYILHGSEEEFSLDKLLLPDQSYRLRLALDMGSYYQLSDTYLLQLQKKKPILSLQEPTNLKQVWLVHQTKTTLRISSDDFLRKLTIHLNNKTIPMQHFKSYWLYEGLLPLIPGYNQLIFQGEGLNGTYGTLHLDMMLKITQPATKIPSVLYHDIAYSDSPMSITPELFERHIKYLVDQSYYFVSSQQIEQYLTSDLSLPEKSVFISFDDGCRGVLDYAFPILKKYQAHASLYITNSFIGKEGFLSWSELKELADSGYFSIGSHSNALHHQYWLPETKSVYFPIHQSKQESYEQYQQRLLDDFTYSKAEIEKHIQQEVKTFAFPFGVHNSTARKMLSKAGYHVALTSNNLYRTSILATDNPFSLMRYTIRSSVEPQAIVLEEK